MTLAGGLPRAWVTYRPVRGLARDAADLKAHGVTAISAECRSVAEARCLLSAARRHGLRLTIDFPEVTERADLIREAGCRVEDAVLIGGAFRGRAIDRHLFAFRPGNHRIVVEPPVYNPRFAYRQRDSAPGLRAGDRPIAHYFPDIGEPLRAEVIVPLAEFDGRQHIEIVHATLDEAPAGARLERDSVTPDMPASEETAGRRLWSLTFDLSGLPADALRRVGIAVYWAYHGTRRHWLFGRGTASAWAAGTREAMRRHVRRVTGMWAEANGGRFPTDTVFAARFGDECFYVTGHVNAPSVSYPLWDYSPPQVRQFRRRAGQGVEYPRTWGFPEIYGADAYAWWQYVTHEGCARLCAVAREEAVASAPGLLVFRNTTRMGIFDHCNDHDGSGQELLARNLDLVHLDPYPVVGGGYSDCLVRDMSYCAGLARRYRKPLVPWMQAHTYGGPNGLRHVSAAQVDRMAAEQCAQGVDAVVWLGYGPRFTFPATNRAAWDRAAAFHRRLAEAPPAKPRARLAVLRFYRERALSHLWENRVRNPADWLLVQFLEVWAVERGQPYDVFEVPPARTRRYAASLARALRAYPYVVANGDWPGAWVIGVATRGRSISQARAESVRRSLRAELARRGWLGGCTPPCPAQNV